MGTNHLLVTWLVTRLVFLQCTFLTAPTGWATHCVTFSRRHPAYLRVNSSYFTSHDPTHLIYTRYFISNMAWSSTAKAKAEVHAAFSASYAGVS